MRDRVVSYPLFNIFLEQIMADGLADYACSVKVGTQQVHNLWFADEIALIASSRKEFQDFTNRLDATASSYGMEINVEKSKVIKQNNGTLSHSWKSVKLHLKR